MGIFKKRENQKTYDDILVMQKEALNQARKSVRHIMDREFGKLESQIIEKYPDLEFKIIKDYGNMDGEVRCNIRITMRFQE